MRELLRESNLIEGIDDPEADQQAEHAWKLIISGDKLTHGVIKQCQKILTLKQNLRPNQRGYYRGEAGDKTDVRVGYHTGVPYKEVRRKMDNWLTTLEFTHPHTAHVEFEAIHPFADGNGRTGRLIMWWQQLQRGEEFTVLTAAERGKYYAWFRAAETEQERMERLTAGMDELRKLGGDL
jgi:Fic family protein